MPIRRLGLGLLAVGLALAPPTATARTWLLLAQRGDSRLLADVDTLQVVAGRIHVDLLLNLTPPQVGKREDPEAVVGSLRFRAEGDCATRQSQRQPASGWRDNNGEGPAVTDLLPDERLRIESDLDSLQQSQRHLLALACGAAALRENRVQEFVDRTVAVDAAIGPTGDWQWALDITSIRRDDEWIEFDAVARRASCATGGPDAICFLAGRLRLDCAYGRIAVGGGRASASPDGVGLPEALPEAGATPAGWPPPDLGSYRQFGLAACRILAPQASARRRFERDTQGMTAFAGTAKPAEVARAQRVYPAESRSAGETGRVVVGIALAADGSVIEAVPIESSGYARLDDAAVSFVRARLRFEPAKSEGKPAGGRVALPMRFDLDD